MLDLDDNSVTYLLEQFDARQVLHVTYGSVLDEFYTELMEILLKEQDLYDQFLKVHFKKHLDFFYN